MCIKKCDSTNLNHRAVLNKYRKVVKNLQSRIFRAAQSGNNRKQKNLQKLLMRSQSNLVLALVKYRKDFNASQKFCNNTKKLLLKNHKYLLLDMMQKTYDDFYDTSLHKSLNTIKSQYKNHAVVFELSANKHLFQKYVINFFSHFPYKKNLCEVLKKQNSHKMLKNFAYTFYSKLHNTHKEIKFIFYKDKLIVLACSKEQLKMACRTLYPLLDKSGIVIESQQYSKLEQGIEFSGFFICNRNNNIVIEPSNFEVKKHMNHLQKLWRWARGKDIAIVIEKMNSAIKEWCSYFRHQQSNRIFKELRTYQLKKQQKWALSYHPKKSKEWVFAKYFGGCNWRFTIDSVAMLEHTDFRICCKA
ncbi:reverse transcriptase N-terminal domain-containing protein [Candidatus Uabimicrobium sp. HlEnr_7]|uniref:reverse transcriptase N-terminal domain-containing protein n=1 Tax=Candidatus Uabimicrobium helgolandensis TaxID=3095367 RepID=UPI0035580BFD